MQQTLGIIKPDAVAKGYMGKIIDRVLTEGFAIRSMRLVLLTKSQAEGFYAEHKGKGFFDELITFMTSGAVVLMLLEGDDAIERWRAVMGKTNPADAAEGALRKQFGASIGNNAVHGSDAPASADRETKYFFNVFDRV